MRSKNLTKNTNQTEKQRLGYLEGYISIFLNTALFALKFWAGTVTGSVAIVADAWHTFSDSLSSLVLLMGFKISSKPADKEHPFGHGRIEIVASVVVGTMLAIVGFNFLVESIQRFTHRQEASFGSIAYIVTIVSILGKEIMARLALKWGKKIDSELLRADGWHHRSDAISSLVILLGIFIGKYFWWIDSVLGIIMSFVLFHATYEILKSSVSHLMGEKPNDRFIENMNRIVCQNAQRKLFLHHIHLHQYGDHNEVTFHIKLPGNMTLKDAHDIADGIEQQIREELNIEATIHLEPLGSND